MNIVLKQKEIETAIRQYVANQGFNLVNKTMAMEFTSGRGDKGISVELVIEEAAIPGFGADDEPVTIGLVVCTSPMPDCNQAPTPTQEVAVESSPEVISAAEPVAEVATEDPAVKTTSLFGN